MWAGQQEEDVFDFFFCFFATELARQLLAHPIGLHNYHSIIACQSPNYRVDWARQSLGAREVRRASNCLKNTQGKKQGELLVLATLAASDAHWTQR